MSLSAGTRLGPYEILSPLGAGGMGEVYRAHDPRLNRDIAIKILPEAFAADADRISRFQREAQVLASLNHPNIAHIYGVEHANGVQALLLEFVGGPTLADRIAQGPIPLDEALPIARQIAEALEAAHDRGIIHRDLKPANIKLTLDGKVKVLDFGLAKAMDPLATTPSNAAMTNSPTITSPALVTGIGVLLGTAAYMSPEQARGKPADRRADIWAFGCVLYEMVTGKRAFGGDEMTDTLAFIITKEADWAALPANTPAAIRRLLRRCLEKDRNRRLADIADARLEIDEGSAKSSMALEAVADAGRPRWTMALGWMLSVLAAVAVTIVVIQIQSSRVMSLGRPVVRLDLNLPSGVELYSGSTQTIALSPDGTRVAFVGVLGGVRQLYIRRLDQVDASPLRGTENSNGCFFSPDGSVLGVLTAGGALKKVSLADGLVVALAADVDFLAGGAWGPDGRVTFGRRGTLWQVPAAGGPATQITRLDPGKSELSHGSPTVLGDGNVILFTVVTGSGRSAAHIEALTLATNQRQVLVDPGAFPLYAPSGHLIFFRNDALLASAFAVDRLAVTGPSVRVVEDLAVEATGGPMVALSPAGVLMYPSSGQATSRIVWVSRQGLEQSMTETPRHYENPRLAPGGRQVVVTADGDLWIQDTARATFTRLTSNETAGNSFPTWTPDGTRVIFRTRTGLQWIDVDGSARSQAIPGTSVNDYPGSVSPDGVTLAFTRITPDTSADVYALSLQGEPQPYAIVNGPAYEGGPQFSPDGRWLAYASDESGTSQVYVRPFPGPDRRWLLSTQGGRQPRWNRNGKEVFYRDGNKMMLVDVSTHPELVLSPPQLLFNQRYAFGVGVTTPNYDVDADGQRFVMVKGESGSGRLNVVQSWLEELKAKVPTK